jgi:DNA (cytosine-5)-methyltransferase 1
MSPVAIPKLPVKMTFGSLFSGIGGIDLGLERAGIIGRWQVENDPFCSKILAKHWPEVKRYGDITRLDGTELEKVDLIAGGFPCQDISLASRTGAGIVGARSGLWKDFARMVAAVRPTFVLVENVPALRNRGLAMVLQDLWALEYDAEWHCIPACALGANHERDRIWIVSYPQGMFGEAIVWGEPDRDIQDVQTDDAHHARVRRRQGRTWRPLGGYSWQRPSQAQAAHTTTHVDLEPLVGAAIARGERHAWTDQPGVGRMVHGIPHRVDRLVSLGNVAVPQVVEWIGVRIMAAL